MQELCRCRGLCQTNIDGSEVVVVRRRRWWPRLRYYLCLLLTPYLFRKVENLLGGDPQKRIELARPSCEYIEAEKKKFEMPNRQDQNRISLDYFMTGFRFE